MTIRSITSCAHDLVRHAVLLQKDGQYRKEQQKVLVEGSRTVFDLMCRHTPIRLYAEEKFMQSLSHNPCPDIVMISQAISHKISDVKTPEGIFAEFTLPVHLWEKNIQRMLILDGIQDPGNIGTLLRTALAFDIRSILCIQPCCDPWSPKVVRSAKGAQFDLHLHIGSWEDVPQYLPLFVADIHGTRCSSLHPDQWALVLGNEARGAQIERSRQATNITIPMSGPIESLNVAQAGAILLHQFSS